MVNLKYKDIFFFECIDFVILFNFMIFSDFFLLLMSLLEHICWHLKTLFVNANYLIILAVLMVAILFSWLWYSNWYCFDNQTNDEVINGHSS